MRYIHLRLIRKPSETGYGLDLSRSRVGDIIVVTPHSALRLIAEGCGVEAQPSQVVDSRVVYSPSRATVS